ncbi:MAG: gamma-glutamyltransferase [Verrucomicrobia bacterium]|nr:gamma-glutamyltransferase [Verrucomicrobiota bacterium]
MRPACGHLWFWPAYRRLAGGWLALTLTAWTAAAAVAVPVQVEVVSAPHAMVVAGHPQAAQAGVEILKAGGNAIDAAVAVSLALGVAEPYGSGLGGKLMLLYHEARSGRTYVVDAMDAAGSLDVPAYLRRPEADHDYGYGAVCVPGLAAGLWAAHQRWGVRKWADDVAPAVTLAREGFEVLPKTREFFAEQEEKLRRGDPEIARLYLPGGRLPAVGSHLPNPDLVQTLELLARHGRDGFYRGAVAEAIASAAQHGGGVVTLEDLARYEARLTEPIGIDFRGYHVVASPPPTSGAPLFLTIMKALEEDDFSGGPLRTAANLDRIGRVWRVVQPLVQRGIADVPEAAFNFEKLVAPDSIRAIRQKARLAAARPEPVGFDESGATASALAATTHFLVADADGNVVCATQSQSLHFGAGVVPPGTGVVLNDSMSNFSYTEPSGVNYVAPGKRPRSTIAPVIVLRAGRPVIAIGIPGAARIPTAMLQALMDRLTLGRPLADAIGDTRIHFNRNWRRNGEESIETEASLPETEAAALRRLGWKVVLAEPAGTGRLFGGINAIEFEPGGGYRGYADPRRTNHAAGY